MEDERFDELTRSLATRVSRRGMLKVLAATTLGSVVIGSRTGKALARNSDCAHWCNDRFSGESRGDCKSDAAHGQGLCHSPCGLGGSGGTLCGGPDYASTTCCATGKSVCVSGSCCTPATTCPAGQNCGTASNGCGGTVNCGTCTAPQTCGGGGTPGACGCTPATACSSGQNCGTASDGCGGTINCGTCTAPQTCGGGGVPNHCGCTPATACPAGQTCGTAPDGCGGNVKCGSCASGQTCTSSGTCCTPNCSGKTCGPDGCGGTCGTCSSGQTCSSSGTCVSSGFCFMCPPSDLAARPLQDHSQTTSSLFCRYETTPNDFFCKYFLNTGLEMQDHDDGFCPPVADVSTTCS